MTSVEENRGDIIVVYNKQAGCCLGIDRIREIVGPKVGCIEFDYAKDHLELLYWFEKIVVAGGDGTTQVIQGNVLKMGRENTIMFPLPGGSKNAVAETAGWKEGSFEKYWQDIVDGNYTKQQREAVKVIIGSEEYLIGFGLGLGPVALGLLALEWARKKGFRDNVRTFLAKIAGGIQILFDKHSEIITDQGEHLTSLDFVTEKVSRVSDLDIPGQGLKALTVKKEKGLVNRIKQIIQILGDEKIIRQKSKETKVVTIRENVEEIVAKVTNCLVYIESWPWEKRYTGEIVIRKNTGRHYLVAIRDKGSSQEESSETAAT